MDRYDMGLFPTSGENIVFEGDLKKKNVTEWYSQGTGTLFEKNIW